MKSIFLLFTLIALTGVFRPETSQAGQERGNGGDLIVCSKNGAPEVMFYDMYEAEARFALPPVMPRVEGLDKKVEALIARLDVLNPTRSELYREWYATFWAEANLIPGIDLVDIPDTGSGFIPRGCHLEQLVVQKEPMFPREKRYTFSRDLWDLMSDDHRAATVLHELILREARLPENAHETSEESRYLNAMILGNELPTLTPQQLVGVLRSIHFAQADVGGFSISTCDAQRIEFLTPYQLKKAPLHQRVRLAVQGQEFRAEAVDRESRKRVCGALEEANIAGSVEFHDNGQINYLDVPGDIRPGLFRIHLDQDGYKGEMGAKLVRFDPSGRILTLHGKGQMNSDRIESNSIKFRLSPQQGHFWLDFNEENKVEFSGLECGNAVALIENQWRTIHRRLTVHQNGTPISYTLCQKKTALQ